MVKVGSCQFNYSYRSRVFFPYSIAMLIGYIKTKKELDNILSSIPYIALKEALNQLSTQIDTNFTLCLLGSLL